MSDEVKLSPEEVERVEAIIDQAFRDMQDVARGIGGQGEALTVGYQGGGTAQGVETYENLGRNGQALAEALEGLSRDLGLTSAQGRETDAEAASILSRVQSDPAIANNTVFG
ncbi:MULTISPECIES: WXG100 family type VII secretion target [Streptomyces]|uniref:Uncharacterized protein n=1 Tax=Streptomyces cheonanensis TaxID=312720 RepID=A0ABN2VJ54_9ACTN|nr:MULTISPECIES: hypothetical protein [Streptomyces]MCK1815719.1 aliphatic sulfonate ABC transporter substrate-binding protein [Streptomyces sp. XM4011]QKV71318.1 aliphatic sulfonate ABC transporter substrate-binding protein [Streptomyces harbinensis]